MDPVRSEFKTELDIFTTLCWKIGTPIAWKALCAVQRSDWLGLVSIKVRPSDYAEPARYLEDAQIASFFKKFPGFKLGFDLDKKARDSFYAAEGQCFQTNERLSPLLFDLGHYGDSMRAFVRTWRKIVRNVLGRAPAISSLKGSFGPGSTFRNVGDNITIAHKLSDDYTRTERTGAFLHSWDLTAWSRYAARNLDTVGDILVAEYQGTCFYREKNSYATRDFEVVRGNRFTTVPKDATKLRGICIEPSLNVYYQLAVGKEISQRMRVNLGWDKRNCKEYHMALARIGSLTGAIATIDLSSASDTICTNLVRLILPPDWVCLLNDLRSPFTLIDGKWVRLEKFSSMGNGFTFELETLLFWSLCLAVQAFQKPTECPYTPGVTTSVFGDDIIVPTSVSRSVVAALNFFGFTINEDKTFLKGPFRESCGGDYFRGSDVRPHYLKEVLDAPHRLISLANGIRRFSRRYGDLGGDSIARSAWFRALDYIPRAIRRCRGPEALGDVVIHDDESRWSETTFRNSIRYLRVWRPVPNRMIGWEQWRPGVQLAAALYGVDSGSPSLITGLDSDEFRRGGWIPRIGGSYVSGYRFGRVAYS